MTAERETGPVAGRAPDRAGARLGTAGLLVTLLGAGLSIVDFFIVNIALPVIDRDLHTSTATLQLVVAAYGIAYGVLLVLGGRLGDAYGRRRVFVHGLTLFTVTSLACGLAPTAGTLVAARAAQGAAAALMVPQVLATIQAATTPERRSRAIGWYGATSGLSMIVGQVLGGLLVSSDVAGLGWRPIFLVNVPIGLAALALARHAMPETRATRPVAVDRAGTPLLSGVVLVLLLPLVEGPTLGWPVWTWLLLAAAPLLAVAFVATQRRSEREGRLPLLPPSVVGVPGMRRGLLLIAPFFACFGAFMFVYAVTFQDGLGMDPFAVGLAISPMAAAFLTASLVSGRLVLRYGQRVVVLGAAVQAAGIGVLAITVLDLWPDPHPVRLAPAMLIAGFGQGLVMTTVFRVVLSGVPTERAGVGSGVLATAQQVSLAAGVATLGSAYVWLSAGVLDARYAFAIVMLCQVAGALVIVVAGRTLPDPRS